MNNPWLTIAIPYYDGPAYLRTAVASLRVQKAAGWQCVIVDDCGPGPGAREVVADLIARDARFAVIEHPANRGVAGAFNTCVQVARGEHSPDATPWLTIMGADDVLAPAYVGAVGRARDEPVSVISPSAQPLDTEGRAYWPLPDIVKYYLSPRTAKTLRGWTWAASLGRGNWHYFPALAWRVEALAAEPFDPRLTTVMDLRVLLDLAAGGHACAVLPDTVFGYRRHGASVSSVTAADGRRFIEERECYEHIANRALAAGALSAALWCRVRPTSRINAALSRGATLLRQQLIR